MSNPTNRPVSTLTTMRLPKGLTPGELAESAGVPQVPTTSGMLLTALEEQTSNLQDALQKLETAIEPALCPPSPEVRDEEVDRSPESALCTRLEETLRRVRICTDYVLETTRRVRL
jgi:hypothetical protein